MDATDNEIYFTVFFKNFFLGAMGCGICGAFPFIAGISTTVTNMGIIYTSSPIFIILLSSLVKYDCSYFYRLKRRFNSTVKAFEN